MTNQEPLLSPGIIASPSPADSPPESYLSVLNDLHPHARRDDESYPCYADDQHDGRIEFTILHGYFTPNWQKTDQNTMGRRRTQEPRLGHPRHIGGISPRDPRPCTVLAGQRCLAASRLGGLSTRLRGIEPLAMISDVLGERRR